MVMKNQAKQFQSDRHSSPTMTFVVIVKVHTLISCPSWRHPWSSRFRALSSSCSCAACLFDCQYTCDTKPSACVAKLTPAHGEPRKRTLLPAGLLDLGGHAVSDEPVAGLELLHGLGAVVDESEASGLATTEVCLEAENGDILLLGLVELTELAAELVLGDVRAVGVENIAIWQPSDLVDRNYCQYIVSCTYTTIWRRPRRGLRMNLRVRRVTWESDMVADVSTCAR
jgi:hypothetical protein